MLYRSCRWNGEGIRVSLSGVYIKVPDSLGVMTGINAVAAVLVAAVTAAQ